MNLLQWFNQHAVSFTLILAYIPLIATVVTTIVSLVLVRATLRYSEASDRSLALSREQFEREWAPELHIKLERMSSREARIFATNLAKISVLMQMVQMRKLSMAVPSLRYFLNEPLVGGTTWSEDLGKRFFACTGDDYEGQIAVSHNFLCRRPHVPYRLVPLSGPGPQRSTSLPPSREYLCPPRAGTRAPQWHGKHTPRTREGCGRRRRQKRRKRSHNGDRLAGTMMHRWIFPQGPPFYFSAATRRCASDAASVDGFSFCTCS